MYLNTEIQPRKKLRLGDYDYKSPGYYFVTICTNNRDCLFGNISSQNLHLNDAGNMVKQAWLAISNFYFDWSVDTLVVMPNHIHVILAHKNSAMSSISLSQLIANIKSFTTNRYIDRVINNKWPGFTQRLWQKNYYEHIIKNMASLKRIRKYIHDNPSKWNIDQNNPINIKLMFHANL